MEGRRGVVGSICLCQGQAEEGGAQGESGCCDGRNDDGARHGIRCAHVDEEFGGGTVNETKAGR